MPKKKVNTITTQQAKQALDKVINKSRAHWYKPIQIAEILYQNRTAHNINLEHLEDYRTKSKEWRDDITLPLLGRVCTSSAKFQDNIFDENAIPPRVLKVLGEENIRTNGAVEAYIYRCFFTKQQQFQAALSVCLDAKPDTFFVKNFIDAFWKEPGLKRSIDKVYEIIVYSLFETLVEAMELKVSVFISEDALPILTEFEDFSQKVMCLDAAHTNHIQSAKLYRVGVTNAADRGLDMYSNWGPAIQIKHLSLDPDLAEEIVTGVSSDKLVIVCKNAERKVIQSLLTQIGWRSHIQSIVTEEDLINWYEKALRGTYASKLSQNLLDTLAEEISLEFPHITKVPDALQNRHYDNIIDDFWHME